MLSLSFVLLALVAVGGVTLALWQTAPGFLRLGHGLGAALGLMALLVAALQDGRYIVWIAFGLVAAGFAGGALLFGVIYKSRPPMPMIAGHGALNLVGVCLLGYAATVA